MAEEISQIEEIEQAEAAAKALEGKEEVVEGEETTEKSKKDKHEKENIGILNIYTSQNNTILTVTDMAGNTIARSSGGQSTKQSRLKASPTVAMFASKKIGEEAKEAGVTSFYIRVRAETGSISAGSAAHAIVKSLGRDGFKILSICELTKQPRGGPKKAGGRRGRRV